MNQVPTSEEEEFEDLISLHQTKGIEEEIPKVADKKKSVQWMELIGSSLLFASAYLILYIFYDFVTALASAHFDMEPTLRYDTIIYGKSGDHWYPHAVKRAFSVGAVAIGAVGVGSYLLFLVFRKSFIFVRLFLLWGSIISFTILAQRMMSVPFAGNFEYRELDSIGFELAIFTSYMYYKPSTEWAIGFLGFLLVISIGIFYAKPFLQTAWSSKQIGSEAERYRFLRQQVLIPVIFGSTIVTIVVFPINLIPNSISFVAAIICLLVMIIHAMLMGSFKIPRQKTWERWPIVPTIVFILVIVMIKTVLTTGISIPNPDIYQFIQPSLHSQ
ncbi:MAG: hypothetical protein GC178_18755 [Flavobacteriales bacterium]|nr:hypothetical protein [Flavobacteriales bacterium]